jgi:tetratricopeptide (TPR) repeat protein
VLCQFCGSPNPDGNELCKRCGNKLLVLSGPPEETLEESEEQFFQAQEELEEHLLERITAIEDTVRQILRVLGSTAERLAQLEHNLTVAYSGVRTLGNLLETQGVVSRTEVLGEWERTVGRELLTRDLARRFRERSQRILSLAEHSGEATPELRRRLNALELALVSPHSDLAQELLTDLAGMTPNNDELWSFIGEAAFETGDLESARIAFHRVLDLRGPHFETLVYLGTVASDLKLVPEAERYLTQARDMAPDSFLPHFSLGALAVLQEQHRAALKHLDIAIKIDHAPQALYLKGMCHLRLEQPGKAIEALRRAVENAPGFEEALYQLGIAYLRRGWSRLALDAFQQVLKLDPQRLQYQETVRLLRLRPPTDLPPKAARLVTQAEKALEHDRTERALELFAAAAKAAPEQAGLQATAALLASALQRHRMAIAYAHQLLRTNPQGSPYLAAAVVALLESLRAAGRPLAARRVASRLYRIGEDRLARGMAAYELALVESELGENLQAARDLAREALEITPKELRHYPLAALGAIAIKRGRFREAVKYLEQATEMAPQPLLLRQLAVARLGTGDNAGAEQALGLAQQSPTGGLGEELLDHVRRLGSLVGELNHIRNGSRGGQ